MIDQSAFDKSYLRDYYMELRKNLSQDNSRKEALDMEIQTRLIISPEYRSSNTVLVYFSRPFEIATSMIIFASLANHKKVGIPVCTDDHTMIFREIKSLNDLKPGRYGISEPPESCAEIVPDENTLCVCPSLCCDLRGFRLGFGGGYYDRFLAGFPGKSAALCYSDSVVPSLKRDEFDIPVDIIHTDNFSRTIQL